MIPFTILVFKHGDTIYPRLCADEAPTVRGNTVNLATLRQHSEETFRDFLERANDVMDLFATRNNCDFVELSYTKSV